MARLRSTLVGRRRGRRTPEGTNPPRLALVARWQREGEKAYFSEVMLEKWTGDAEFQAHQQAGRARHKARPGAIEAMRERVNAARKSKRWKAGLQDWWRARHLADRFPTAEALGAWLEAEYANGRSVRSIAAELGMAHMAATRRLKERGVAVAVRGIGRASTDRSQGHLAKHGITHLAEFDATVSTLFDEGHPVDALRAAYGISADAIRTSLKRTGRHKGRGFSDKRSRAPVANRPPGPIQKSRHRRPRTPDVRQLMLSLEPGE